MTRNDDTDPIGGARGVKSESKRLEAKEKARAFKMDVLAVLRTLKLFVFALVGYYLLKSCVFYMLR